MYEFYADYSIITPQYMRKIAEIFFSKQDTKDFMNRHTWTASGSATLKPY